MQVHRGRINSFSHSQPAISASSGKDFEQALRKKSQRLALQRAAIQSSVTALRVTTTLNALDWVATNALVSAGLLGIGS